MKNTKKVLEYSIFAGLFLIPFIPFIVPGSFFFPFITGKGFTFRILTEVLFALFVILAFVDREYRPKLSWITKSVIAFTVVVYLADLFGENSYKSLWSNYERMEGFVLIFHMALYYILASSFLKTSSRWVKYFNATVGASILVCFYAFLQLVGKININQGSERVDATFGNATYLAIYLVFNIFITIYLFLSHSKEKWQKWTYGLVVLVQLVILYFTATRGAILGLIGGLILAGLIIAFKERENTLIRKISYGILGSLAVIILIFFSIKNTDFVRNSHVLSRFSTLSFSEIKTQGRYFVWPMAFKGIAERPILGWGQENFNFVFNKYYDPRMYAQEQWFDRTHNVFLDWLIAGGILGFMAYISLYIAIIYYIWRKRSVFNLSEKAVFTGMMAAYIFHNIFVFDNLISYILFFSILAYVHSISEEKTHEKSRFYEKNFNSDTVFYVIMPTVFVLTVGMVYYVNIPAMAANTTLIRALSPQGDMLNNLELFKQAYDYESFGDSEITEQLVQSAVSVYGSQTMPANTKQKFYELAKSKIEKKVLETPNDARYLMFAGSFYNRTGQYNEAIKYLNKAVEVSPKKQSILVELGTSYLGNRQPQKMFEMFKKAYELEPKSDESAVIYAAGAIYTGNNTILKEMVERLGRDRFISDDRIIKAYSDVGDYNTVIQILNARILKDPNNRQNKLTLAYVYSSIGQKQNAVDIIRSIISSDSSFKDEGESYIKQILGQ